MFFFGFSLQRRKSKKEVMDEIIMKSKLGKVIILTVFPCYLSHGIVYL